MEHAAGCTRKLGADKHPSQSHDRYTAFKLRPLLRPHSIARHLNHAGLRHEYALVASRIRIRLDHSPPSKLASCAKAVERPEILRLVVTENIIIAVVGADA